MLRAMALLTQLSCPRRVDEADRVTRSSSDGRAASSGINAMDGKLFHQLAVYFGLSEPSDEEAKSAASDRVELRSRLRQPSYWLVTGVLACCVGAGAEGAASLMGDGRFDVAVALRWSAVSFVAVSIARVWEGFNRD